MALSRKVKAVSNGYTEEFNCLFSSEKIRVFNYEQLRVRIIPRLDGIRG